MIGIKSYNKALQWSISKGIKKNHKLCNDHKKNKNLYNYFVTIFEQFSLSSYSHYILFISPLLLTNKKTKTQSVIKVFFFEEAKMKYITT